MKAAIIPARGGSKRIPRKNIRPFHGKPMIAWSIEAARACGLFERVIVSTDDEEIARVAEEWGAEVPFMRPAELASDHAGATAVVTHATQWLIDQRLSLDAVCCILATAPFIRTSDIQAGWSLLASGDWDYSFGVTDFAAPVFRAFKEAAGGGVEMIFPQYFATRSQDLPVALHDAAQFYWGRPHAWLEGKRVFDLRSKPVMIPRWRVQDIDTEDDWTRAEMLAPSLLREAQAAND